MKKVLCQIPYFKTGPQALFQIRKCKRYDVRIIRSKEDHALNHPKLEIEKLHFLPDFYIVVMLEWHFIPLSVLDLPCPIFAHVGDPDLHIQAIEPWLHVFDGLIVTSEQEKRNLSALTDRPIHVSPKVFGVDEDLPALACENKPIDVLITGTTFHPYHPDKTRLTNALINTPDLNVICYNGALQRLGEFLPALHKAKMTFSYVRFGEALPTRALDSLSMGAAAIVQRESVLCQYYKETEGVFTYDGTPESLIETCRYVRDHWKEIYPCVRRGAALVRKQFCMSRISAGYFDFVAGLADNVQSGPWRHRRRDLLQKRCVVNKGWKQCPDEVAYLFRNDFLKTMEDSIKEATDFVPFHEAARLLVMEYDAANQLGSASYLEPFLSLAFRYCDEALGRWPSALALVFNYIRFCFHYGDPARVRSACALALDILSREAGYWKLDPMDDLMPYDFFPIWFNYRSYFDEVVACLGDAQRPKKHLVDLIYAGVHYYLSHYEKRIENLRSAVVLDPEFAPYQVALGKELIACGQVDDGKQVLMGSIPSAHDAYLTLRFLDGQGLLTSDEQVRYGRMCDSNANIIWDAENADFSNQKLQSLS